MTTLLFFARVKDAAGASFYDVEADTLGEALDAASKKFGEEFTGILSTCSVVVNGRNIPKDKAATTRISESDEIAVLPPVSGGQDARMVDVGDKEETKREATAVCTLVCEPDVRDAVLKGSVPKGDAVGAARIAGILAAKRVPELIPMCHPVRISSIDVWIESAGAGIEVRATVRGRDRTGFEIEALTACSVAALTLYDMGKSEDPRMRIDGLRVVAKSGGKSGSVTYE